MSFIIFFPGFHLRETRVQGPNALSSCLALVSDIACTKDSSVTVALSALAGDYTL